MATGDFTLFNEHSLSPGSEKHLFGGANDVLKVMLIDNTTPPTAADTTPTYSDYSANEMTEDNYTAGGEEITNDTWTQASGVASLAGDDVSWSQHATGFSDAYWAVVYNDTEATKMAIGFIELGGPVGNVAGDLTIEWTGGIVFTHDVT